MQGHEVKYFSMTQAPSEGGTRKKEKSKFTLPSAVNQDSGQGLKNKKINQLKLYTVCAAKTCSGNTETK